MASFPGKIGWKRQRKKENKKLSFCFVPTRRVTENSKKNRKKIPKINKYRYGFISSLNRLGKDEKGENKNYRSIPLLPEAKQKIQK